MSAYLQDLNRYVAATAPTAAEPRDLRSRFAAWYTALPEFARQRPFAMAEFEAALDTQGRYLSPVLIDLGWRRGRQWVSRHQYLRFWLPPRS